MGAEPQFVTTGTGERIAVVLPIEEYEDLLEDVHDLAAVAERRDEPRIPFEEIKRRLRADGILSD